MSGVFYYSSMFQAVPHLAQVQKHLDGTFISNRPSTIKATRRLYPEMPTARYFDKFGVKSRAAKQVKRADVIVTGSPYNSFLSQFNAKRCITFHGTYMFATEEAVRKYDSFDLACLIGPRQQQMFQRYELAKNLKMEVTGFLPFDEFPQTSPEYRERLLLAMGLDPNKKTVLYTPSSKKVGSWTRVAEALVRTAPEIFNLVLRPHPRQSVRSRSSDRHFFQFISKLGKQRGNTFLDLADYKLGEVMMVSDLIVSDANSPAEESLFYDIPQLLIETPNFSKNVLAEMGRTASLHKDDLEQLLMLYDCGERLFVNSAPTFDTVLVDAIDKENMYQRNRDKYFAWVFGERGRTEAGGRVADAIRSYLL